MTANATCFLSCSGVVLIGVAASAQSSITGKLSFVFPNGSQFSGGTPLPVEVWLEYDPQAYAWATYSGSIVSNDVGSVWSGLQSNYLNVPGSSIGTPVGGNVESILVGQPHFPPIVVANTANPILIWSGAWSTDSLTPRSVEISSVTMSVFAYGQPGTGALTILLDDPTAQIQVIPAPPAFAFLALAGGLACRRRRARIGGLA